MRICFISAVNICVFIHFRRDEDDDDEEDDCGRADDVFEAEALERGEYIVSRDSSSDDSRDRSPVRSQHGRGRNRGGRGRAQGGRGRARGRRVTSRRGGSRSQESNTSKSYDDVDTNHTLPPFQPRRPIGINFDRYVLRGGMTTELEFFHLFLTPEMIKSVVTHTNSYAYMKIVAGGHRTYTSGDGSWQATTVEEINRLIALMIYFSLVRVDSVVEKYWSTKTLYHGLWARKILSRTRYKALMAFLHVVDPADETPGDKLCKVDEFIKMFKERCSSLYQPSQNIAVDERMVKSKHRSGIRQYMKNKPTKYGIKLWVLADSSNGYTIDFNVYIGKSQHEAPSSHGLGYDVVMKLVRPYFGQGYQVFFDNFFSSPKLVHELFLNKTPSSGTARVYSEGFPEGLKNVKAWAKKEERGAMRWEREANVLTLQWVDNKPVSLLTSIDSANEKVVVKRRMKVRGVYQEVDVVQPLAIHRYNQYMNAVDRSDQMLACHSIYRKCYRWWKTLFFHLIDIAIVNGFLLFQEHRANHPDTPALHRKPTYSIVDFREELVRQMCALAEYDRPPVYEAVQAVPPNDQFCTVHIPMTAEGNTRRRCVVCSAAGRQSKVKTYCSAPQCNKFMHVGAGYGCFQEWHSHTYAGKRP